MVLSRLCWKRIPEGPPAGAVGYYPYEQGIVGLRFFVAAGERSGQGLLVLCHTSNLG